MAERPDMVKALGGLGCLMLLIPVVLVLAGLFVAVAVTGGVIGVLVAAALVAIAVLVAWQARRPRPWRCPSCGGVFAAGSAHCPHCGVAVGPPSG